MQLPELDHLRAILIDAARSELLPRFAGVQRRHKADGSIITAADLAAQENIRAALRQRWPQYAFLGEEMSEQEQAALFAQDGAGLWCLDPLDGTSNYAAGLPCFAISLALLVERRIVLGMVYDPVRDECFAAAHGQGATLNGAPLRCVPAGLPLKRALAVVDFKRLAPALAAAIASRPPYSSQRSFGSVALDWCWLAANRYHVYLHGKQKLWDYAAGALILAEAGGFSATLDGAPVYAHTLTPRSAVAAPDQDLFNKWQTYLRAAGA